MKITAKDIAEERECPVPVRNESYFLNNTGPDIGAQVKFRQLESVMPVRTDELQRYRYSSLHRNLTRSKFESLRGNANHLFVASRFLHRGSRHRFLIEVTDGGLAVETHMRRCTSCLNEVEKLHALA